MNSLDDKLPQARSRDVLSSDMPDGVVVYDSEREHFSHLNRTAAHVWRHCDGRSTVRELIESLRQADLPADEAVVWLALDRLEKAHLLAGPTTQPAAEISRRAAIRKLALAGGMAALLPIVTSIAAPTPAMAASGTRVPSWLS